MAWCSGGGHPWISLSLPAYPHDTRNIRSPHHSFSSASPSPHLPPLLTHHRHPPLDVLSSSPSHMPSYGYGHGHEWPVRFHKKSLGIKLPCRAAEYVFPDPIPEFAQVETDKFKSHLLDKLSKKDVFGDSVIEVVGICTEILCNFLHTEYGGPGTLLVIPFIDMADTINERGLPGGPQAARAAVVWAQKHVDNDWKEWTGGNKKD